MDERNLLGQEKCKWKYRSDTSYSPSGAVFCGILYLLLKEVRGFDKIISSRLGVEGGRGKGGRGGA